MESTNALGEFLRARRDLVRPEDVGIGGGGPRRVPGLRREEVAALAGISADYYLRLEQGRDRNPSVQVLQAVARVLRLDADATGHLIGLAGTRPASRPRGARSGGGARHAPPREEVPPSILQLIQGWTHNPAYVQNRLTDVLAVNSLASALSPNYSLGVNLLRAVLLDPAERRLRRDWEETTAEGVAGLRAGAGPEVDDPGLVELVDELSLHSERFRYLWGRHDVRLHKSRVSHLSHPQVGDIDLQSDKLAITGTEGLVLVVFHAAPGSRSAELLDILGSLAVPGGQGSEREAR
ncbi:helix-turn-helix domain-containing protein [Streptomyces sp. TS71-3]|uniref:helix-turn-helix domain-containing protein n=1 Tax=Streptomyces sp. TS71-3 TaxID=2733862 RepID=UPI001B2C80D2|nr:helix-turn-helix domain-containing protein [Streptomyces sp. TS71-3]GHJ42524.1 transcriptional regulator [Streptomyces sp. TS71-3]